MANEAYSKRIDEIVIRMYGDDLSAENANQEIYYASLAAYSLLYLYAGMMDEGGQYSQVIDSVHANGVKNEEQSQNILQRIANLRYRWYDLVEIIAQEYDDEGRADQVLDGIRERFSKRNANASNVNQQMYNGAISTFDALGVLVQLLNDSEAANNIRQEIDDRVRHSINNNTQSIFHQMYYALSGCVDMTELVGACCDGAEEYAAIGQGIRDRMAANMPRANGIFHQIIFLTQAFTEMLACLLHIINQDDASSIPDWRSEGRARAPKPAPKPVQENSVSSRERNDSTPAASSGGQASSSSSSGGCYVATCVYGSYDCPEVWTLRRYRDDTLGATWYGRLFIKTYYAVSPTLVKWFGKTAWFKKLWRGKLDRMVKSLQARGVESTPYRDKEW